MVGVDVRIAGADAVGDHHPFVGIEDRTDHSGIGGAGANADSNGSFSAAPFIIPQTAAGVHTLSATDGQAYSPTINIVVGSRITLSPNVQTVGSAVSVTGNGFTTNSPITFYLDGTAISSGLIRSDGTGRIDTSVTVPRAVQGTHVLMAQDLQGNSATATLVVRPSVSINPQTGSPGTTVQIAGGGFGASLPVTVTYNSVSVETTPPAIVTDATGSFGATFNAPAGTTGSYTVQASDGSNTAASSFLIAAGASLSPGVATVGTSVTVKGVNFGSGATVNILYDGAPLLAATADASGAFSTTFKAPNSQGGSHQVVATDSANKVTMAFTIQPSITLTPASGFVGSNVGVSGVGFGANRAVAVKYDNIQVATATPDATGGFTTSFKAPASQSGNHQLAVTDGVNTTSLVFTIQPSVSVSPTSGNVTTAVTVNGAGFAGGKTATISYDNVQVATAIGDATGAFTASFKAPSSRTGNHQVTASDGAGSGSGAFAIVPSLNLSPAAGNVGSNVAVIGSGFASSTAVTIKYDNTQLGQATTDASGSFSATFSAPASKGGSHLVGVSDGTSTLTAGFAMDSTPPPAPTPQLPADNTQSQAATLFGWSAVTDPSGVTYTLQVASDQAFSAVVLEKKGLVTPGYTLTEQEKLPSASKEKPYYWRVRAVDGASNEGPWSAPKSFYVGFVLSPAGLYIIFAVAALLVGVLGFFIGRKTRAQW